MEHPTPSPATAGSGSAGSRPPPGKSPQVPGAARYLVAFPLHQAIAVFAALVYAVFIDLVGVDVWLWGLIGVLIHLVAAAPVVAVISLDRPRTGLVDGRGSAYKNQRALDVATSVVGYAPFGLTTAIVYRLLPSRWCTHLIFELRCGER